MNFKHLKYIKVSYWIAVTLALYISVSYARYRIIHPEQTETQLALNILDVLKWK